MIEHSTQNPKMMGSNLGEKSGKNMALCNFPVRNNPERNIPERNIPECNNPEHM